MESPIGSFGQGFYFGDDACANQYADDGYILECRLHLSNPVRYKAIYDERSDSYAFDLICQLFPIGYQPYIFELLNSEFSYLGEDFQKAVIALGHDGIVIEYEKNVFEVIAYSKESIELLHLSRINADREILEQTDLSNFNHERFRLLMGGL